MSRDDWYPWPTPKLTKVAMAVRVALADGLVWAGQPARGEEK